jgi:hypothetical protein
MSLSLFRGGEIMMKPMATILSVLLIVFPLQARESKEKSGTADINIGVGELQGTGSNRQDRAGAQLITEEPSDRSKDSSNNTPAALPEPKLDSRTYRE